MVNGVAQYQVWYEMYSSGKQQPEQVISSMTIEPGDSISASAQYITSGTHAGQYELTITDNSRANDSFTTYQTSSQVQSPTAENSSAEWVVEAPSVGNNIASLANFGSVTFTSASATIDGVTGPINDSAWQSQAINIASGNGTLEDTTSNLLDSGTSFVVTDDASSAASNAGSGSVSGSASGSGSGSGQGGSGWWAWARPSAATGSNATALASATPTPTVVVYGTTVIPQSQKSPFGSLQS